MSGAVAPVPRDAARISLERIQAPVRSRLERVLPEIQRIASHELPMIGQVSTHLLSKRGKMFRPTLTLLASAVEGNDDPDAVRLAAAIEMMHLATLVHDDSVDHSSL